MRLKTKDGGWNPYFAGALFGIGWAIMGFCPGTSVAAVGEGRLHALFAITGMLVGAAVFAELYPFLQSTVMAWQDFGKISIQGALGISHWVMVPIFWAATIGLFFLFEKNGL